MILKNEKKPENNEENNCIICGTPKTDSVNSFELEDIIGIIKLDKSFFDIRYKKNNNVIKKKVAM